MGSPGAMKDKVRFEARSTADDGYGNPVTGPYVAQFSRSVEMRPVRGGEQVIAASLQGIQPVRMIVRFDSQTSTIETDWRAVDRAGVVYQIKSAADMDRRRKFIELFAISGVGA